MCDWDESGSERVSVEGNRRGIIGAVSDWSVTVQQLLQRSGG